MPFRSQFARHAAHQHLHAALRDVIRRDVGPGNILHPGGCKNDLSSFLPCATMVRAAAWATRKAPFRFKSRILSQSSGGDIPGWGSSSPCRRGRARHPAAPAAPGHRFHQAGGFRRLGDVGAKIMRSGIDPSPLLASAGPPAPRAARHSRPRKRKLPADGSQSPGRWLPSPPVIRTPCALRQSLENTGIIFSLRRFHANCPPPDQPSDPRNRPHAAVTSGRPTTEEFLPRLSPLRIAHYSSERHNRSTLC